MLQSLKSERGGRRTEVEVLEGRVRVHGREKDLWVERLGVQEDGGPCRACESQLGTGAPTRTCRRVAERGKPTAERTHAARSGGRGCSCARSSSSQRRSPKSKTPSEKDTLEHAAAHEPERVVLVALGRAPHLCRARRPCRSIWSRCAEQPCVGRVAVLPLCLRASTRVSVRGREVGEAGRDERTGARVERPYSSSTAGVAGSGSARSSRAGWERERTDWLPRRPPTRLRLWAPRATSVSSASRGRSPCGRSCRSGHCPCGACWRAGRGPSGWSRACAGLAMRMVGEEEPGAGRSRGARL